MTIKAERKEKKEEKKNIHKHNLCIAFRKSSQKLRNLNILGKHHSQNFVCTDVQCAIRQQQALQM